jgi:hypothetical protein
MILGALAATIAGSAGWWLGNFLGFPAAVLCSIVASVFGLYWGRRWFDDNLS